STFFIHQPAQEIALNILHMHVSNCSVSDRRVLSVTVRLSLRSFQSSLVQTTAEAEMIRSLSLLRYSLNVCQRAHVRLLSSSRGVWKRTFTGGTCLTYSRPVDCGAPAVLLSVSHRSYSTQQTESRELHSFIRDTRTVKIHSCLRRCYSKHEFQAEMKKLLDIVSRSLYSEKEMFIRELLSNSSDALGKLQHKMITAGGDPAPVEIHLQTDAAKDTFTIQVSLNNEELVANLGSIARSDQRCAFLDALQNQVEASSSIIVDVYSQSAEPVLLDTSDPQTVFLIAGASGDDCGLEWQHEEFYRCDKPRYTLHYRADASLNIRSIFYMRRQLNQTDTHREKVQFGSVQQEVQIQTKATHILLKKLIVMITFAVVVESGDIPLNLSRELLQESALIMKLRDVLQQWVIRFLLDQSKKDPEKYARFFDDYGLFLREGIVTKAEQSVKEDIAKLLCFESSALPVGQQTSLMEYASRMKEGKRNIYYLCAPNHLLAEHSAYFEAMKQKDMELFLMCAFNFSSLLLLPVPTFLECVALMKSKMSQYLVTPRLDTHPAMIAVLEMGIENLIETTQLRKPLHDLIKKLHALKDSNPELAQLLLEQTYNTTTITAGLNEDPRLMISQLNQLLTQALEKH
uniref:TNF receptor-associated protein 1 n=1 Tax=Cyprinus carpio carpio TaxID=630221 RepID=A0A9J7WZC2_CYPCA